jgi:benzoyl-CoA-dihydrodiol lyase
MVGRSKRRPALPVTLAPLGEYRYVSLVRPPDAKVRMATLTVRAPDGREPQTPREIAEAGSQTWAIQAWRELDDALLDLRFNHPDVSVVALQTSGDPEHVLAVDRTLAKYSGDGLVFQITLLMKRVLKRLDNTARSLFALVEPGSCFAGSLMEIALAADRVYMLDDPRGESELHISPMNGGPLPMSNGLTRLQSRFLGEPARVTQLLGHNGRLSTAEALAAGLVTFAPDEIDWDDEIRIAFEERASLSPDALTGMEASLRFGGPETMETKIFGRLSAWQNWIFQRPNAVGPRGALTLYGKPERPEFDWRRT